jgi:thymidylate synthase
MKAYIDGAREILENGTWKPNRTGVRTKYISGYMLSHKMAEGFPLLTTKKMNLQNIAVELEFFIRGLTRKDWLQARDCHIWDPWCSPREVTYGNDEETKKKMHDCLELGPIYGSMWRYWPAPMKAFDTYIDQFDNVVEMLQKNPLDRRMVVSAWNPEYLDEMALPPCHFAWQVISDGEKLDLIWDQRSCDYAVGVPYNLAQYALLLLLLAKHAGLVPNKVVGMLHDVHLYEDQIDLMMTQVERVPYFLPLLTLTHNGNIYDWTYDQIYLSGYRYHPFIKYPVAV